MFTYCDSERRIDADRWAPVRQWPRSWPRDLLTYIGDWFWIGFHRWRPADLEEHCLPVFHIHDRKFPRPPMFSFCSPVSYWINITTERILWKKTCLIITITNCLLIMLCICTYTHLFISGSKAHKTHNKTINRKHDRQNRKHDVTTTNIIPRCAQNSFMPLL